jgi:probable HAF family extracellular repeat protein
MISLGGGGGSSVSPSAINDSGIVIGSFGLWKPTTSNGTTGSFFPIAPLPGFNSSAPQAISSDGRIVGSSNSGGTFARAFLWTPDIPNGTSGSIIDLGSLPTPNEYSSAADINNAGDIVGTTGGTGQIQPQNRAFIWSLNSGMIDLNDRLDDSGAAWILQSAIAINDAGLIIGIGLYDPDGQGGNDPIRGSFLLTPIPEPAGTLLALCSLACAMLRLRRC